VGMVIIPQRSGERRRADRHGLPDPARSLPGPPNDVYRSRRTVETGDDLAGDVR
jgi:hypothetical protein